MRATARYLLVALTTCSLALPTQWAKAWSEHPLMAYPALRVIPGLEQLDSVRVRSLQSFLMDNETQLEALLADFHGWAAQHLPYYPPLPEALRFRATGNPEDVVSRFLHALRMNPNARLPLYLHLLPGQELGGRPPIAPEAITTLSDVSSMAATGYVELLEGQMVRPIDVLSTANDEPDYGFDLGLFEDNGTPQGQAYGFGVQPFGDPTLEYGSQAPFHMGFYHEPRIVFFFAPFLRKTLPEYRINQFRTLSVFALQNGEEYWGLRFMGWGMHYVGDLSMPYHASPLPGVSALRMIWINLKAILGFPRARDNALRLVSNKHTVLEEFQKQVLREAFLTNQSDHPLLRALSNPAPMVPYSIDFPRMVVAKESAARSDALDEELLRSFPHRLVADPTFAVSGTQDLARVLEVTKTEMGPQAIVRLNHAMVPLFQSYSMHLASFYQAIMDSVSAGQIPTEL